MGTFTGVPTSSGPGQPLCSPPLSTYFLFVIICLYLCPLSIEPASYHNSSVPICWCWADHILRITSFFSKYLFSVNHMPASWPRFHFDFWCAGALRLFTGLHWMSDLLAPYWLYVPTLLILAILNNLFFFFFCPLY